MDLGLSGKVALVTGASSGIGAATARLLAAEGVDVVVSYSGNLPGAERTAAEVRARGCQAYLLPMDVAEPTAVAAAIGRLCGQTPVLDLAVLCAGVNVVTPWEQVSAEDWDRVVRVNLSGTFYVLHAVQSLIPEGGAIVTVASVAGNTGAPHHPHYAAAKAGVINLTRSAARAAAPEEIARCIVFLASPAASFVYGATLNVNGGRDLG